jgi:3-hydroxyisobutyrate dehydrogenase/2-hydroxymethylglutarate dehydrogenase
MYTQASDEGFGQEDVGAVVKLFEQELDDRVGGAEE